MVPCVSMNWTILSWLWSLKRISANNWITPKIVAHIKSGKKWLKNYLGSFIKVQSKSHILLNVAKVRSGLIQMMAGRRTVSKNTNMIRTLQSLFIFKIVFYLDICIHYNNINFFIAAENKPLISTYTHAHDLQVIDFFQQIYFVMVCYCNMVYNLLFNGALFWDTNTEVNVVH